MAGLIRKSLKFLKRPNKVLTAIRQKLFVYLFLNTYIKPPGQSVPKYKWTGICDENEEVGW